MAPVFPDEIGMDKLDVLMDGGVKRVGNRRSENPPCEPDDKDIGRRVCMRAKKGGETGCLNNGTVGFSPWL